MTALSPKQIQSLMRKHQKTIRGIAEQWSLTQKRVRYVRSNGISGEAYVRDWLEIVQS